MKKDNIFYKPIIALLILAPFLGEMISGSSPPSEFFQLIPMVLFVTLYGFGAVIIRETARRWNKGWVSIFLMGMAYGIFEEGIMVRSFFDAGWPDLGQLAVYGRWIGVNWIWSIALTIFHAVVSISLPIAITELLFPEEKDTLWLTDKGLTIFGFIFLGNALIGPLFGMKITFLGMIFSIVMIIGLVLLAKNKAGDLDESRIPVDMEQWRIILACFVLMVGLVAGLWIFPSLSIPWVITFFFLIGLAWIGVRWLKWLDGMQLKQEQVWACIVGVLIPWLTLDVISELDNTNRLDDTSGMILVVLLFSIFLLTLRIFIWRRTKVAQPD